MSSSSARVIGTFSYKEGRFVSVDKNRRDFNDGLPVAVPVEQMHKYYPLKSDPRVIVGGLINQLHLKQGQIYPIPDGNRIVIKVTKTYVIFARTKDKKTIPGFFIQLPSAFHLQWVDTVRLNSYNKMEATKVLAEWEIQFLMGVIAGSSWTGLGSVIAGDVIGEAISKQKSPVTKQGVRTIYVLFSSYRQLNKIAPILTFTMRTVIGITLINGHIKHIDPSAMSTDPKIAGRAAGVIVTQMGKKGFQQRLTASALLWSILSQVGTKVVTEAPDTILKTLNEFNLKETEEAVENIEKILNNVNVTLTDAHKKVMVKEISQNSVEISRIFSNMLAELKQPQR